MALKLVLLCFFYQLATAQDLSSQTDSYFKITFENQSSQINQNATKIIEKAAFHFFQITKETLPATSIQIRLVDQLNYGEKMSKGGDSKKHIQGITRFTHDGAIIEISNHHTATIERILAHEAVHIFIREVYGKAFNYTLNEGLAEYIAGLLFPKEVRSDLKAAFCGSSTQMYTEGYQFCQQYAKDKYFSDFFAVQIKNKDCSLEQLRELWKLNVLDRQ